MNDRKASTMATGRMNNRGHSFTRASARMRRIMSGYSHGPAISGPTDR